MRAFLLLALLGAPAAAAERVVIASFKMSGEALTDPTRTALRNSLAGGLAAAGFDVAPEDALAKVLRENPALVGCDTDACLRRVASLTSAAYAVRANLELVGGANYHYTLELVGPDTIAHRVDDTCEVCNNKEANDSISNSAAKLHVEPAKRIEITPPPPPPRPRPLRNAGIATATIGGALILTGIGLMAADGTGGVTVGAGNVLMLEHRNTLTPGVVLFLIGAGCGGAAAVLFWKDHRTQLAVTPGPGGAAAYLSGSF
jgi:hypothetical protein